MKEKPANNLKPVKRKIDIKIFILTMVVTAIWTVFCFQIFYLLERRFNFDIPDALIFVVVFWIPILVMSKLIKIKK